MDKEKKMMRKTRIILICIVLTAICSFFISCGPKFTITFNGNGGTLVSGSEYQSVSAISEIIQPVYERDGYNFVGFDKDLSQMGGGTKATLNALWEAKKYNVSLTVGEESNTISVYYDSEYALPILEKDYYDFVGWSIDEDGEEIIDTKGTFKHTSDLSLYPVWTPTEYDITYNLDGGRLVSLNPSTYNVESEVRLSSPTKDGYDFAYWVDEDTDKVITKIEKGSYGKKNFVAVYASKNYSISINANGGSCAVNSVTVKYNETIEELPFPERAGYTFEGWYLSDNQSVKIHSGEKYQFTENVTIVAEWSSKPYSITYRLNGGKLDKYNPGSYSVEDEIVLNAPNKTGYTFVGWKETGVSGYVDKIELGSTGNKILTATYTANKYKLYVNALGGTASESEIEVTYDSKIGVLPNVEKNGHIHLGYTIHGAKITENTVWKFTSDMTAEATYAFIKYGLKFDLDGGKTLESRTSYTIEGLADIVNPTKLNCNFEGWEVVGTNVVITNGKIPAGTTGELTLKAIWKFKFTNITVKFVLEDASLSDSISTVKTSSVNGLSSIPSVKVTLGSSLGNLLPKNVVSDDSKGVDDDARENYAIFKDFCVLKGDKHTLKRVKADTVLDAKFLNDIDLGEDGVLVLYARLGPAYIEVG